MLLIQKRTDTPMEIKTGCLIPSAPPARGLPPLKIVSQIPTCTEGTKEMFYLTTHSTHFIYGYMASDIWLRTILIVRKKPAAATWSTLSDLQQGFFYMHHPTDRIAHTTVFVTPVVEHWLEREIAPWVHPMKDTTCTDRNNGIYTAVLDALMNQCKISGDIRCSRKVSISSPTVWHPSQEQAAQLPGLSV